ncbi:cathepsin G-like [Malaclemys terrapin pileata]|uniref:cathepsin G-like n=1 Tax=Malaclemys terrapin pileata TaxID=2991368 RepID=UPI0023A7A171|nr:cathepsin G-like [Malaclemys terrapin pileata]
MSLTMQLLILVLLPVAFRLPPGSQAEPGLTPGEIIGGWKAQPHFRPYMAYLEIQHRDKKSCCGGFLVSENFVLTAAHCNGDMITMYLGAHSIKQQEQSQQKISVRRHIPHHQFSRETRNNDIMLLQLEHKAELNEQVRLIRLPPAHRRVQRGTVCSIVGWGRTSALSKGLPRTLREVDLKVLDDEACLNYLSGIYRKYKTVMMMCVGDPKEHKASFKGDSGGPLVCGKTAQDIVSWGPVNGSPPRVYTRVSIVRP